MELKVLTEPDSLDCQICTNYMAPKRAMCQLGHSICGDCEEKMNNCPVCYSDFTSNYYIIPENSDKIHQCLHHIYGCQYEDNVWNLIKHRDWCEYEATKCPFNSEYVCKWAGKRKDMITHLRQSHVENSRKPDGSGYFLFDKDGNYSSPKKGCLILNQSQRIYKLAWEIDAKREFIYWYGISMSDDPVHVEKSSKINVTFVDSSKNFSVVIQPWTFGYDKPTKLNFRNMRTLFKNKVPDSVACKLAIDSDDSDHYEKADSCNVFNAHFEIVNYKRIPNSSLKFTPTVEKVLKGCVYSCGIILSVILFVGIAMFFYQLIDKAFK